MERVCDWFRARGVDRIEAFRMVDEDVTFKLPVELRRELQLVSETLDAYWQTRGSVPTAKHRSRHDGCGAATSHVAARRGQTPFGDQSRRARSPAPPLLVSTSSASVSRLIQSA